MRDPKLVQLGVACALTGATAIAIMVVPMYWHRTEAPAQPGALALRFDTPALMPPSAPPFEHRVKTEKYVALTTVAKTPPAQSEPPPQAAANAPQPEARDICQRDGGWKVATRHGGWHCRYPRHRRR